MIDYVDDDNMDNINPELSFTPERRRLEYKLVKDARKALTEIDISEEERNVMDAMWKDYIFEYEHLYQRYHKEQAILHSISLLN